jgi:hypothetical protein
MAKEKHEAPADTQVPDHIMQAFKDQQEGDVSERTTTRAEPVRTTVKEVKK